MQATSQYNSPPSKEVDMNVRQRINLSSYSQEEIQHLYQVLNIDNHRSESAINDKSGLKNESVEDQLRL